LDVVFLMTHAGHARNFELTLRELLARGHRVQVVLLQAEPRDDQRAALLDALVADHPALTVTVAEPRSRMDPTRFSSAIRRVLDYMRYLREPLRSAMKLRGRAGLRVPRILRATLDRLPEAAIGMLRAVLTALLEHLPASRKISREIRRRAPDVLVVTPAVETGTPQTEWIRVARRVGVPVCVALASWDTLTTKGGLHAHPDVLAVWNEDQARDAVQLHGVDPDVIRVTGAVAFDHWFERAPSRDRAALCAAADLDPRRPYLLYVASSGFIAPGETTHIVRCIDMLRRAGRPELERLQVMVRPHPLNLLDEDRERLTALAEVVVYPMRAANPTDRPARDDYFDSMAHAAVVVGVNTSAFVEAAIVDRPLHAHLATEYEGTQLQMPHFRQMAVTGGGPVTLSRTETEFCAAIERALREPASWDEANAAFRDRLLRPQRNGRTASATLAELIEDLGARRAF
jgi:hypothetical protein